MTATTPNGLTEHCLAQFGAIMHWFARHECLMLRVMAKASGADGASVMAMTKKLDFSQKRRALLNLLRHRGAPLDQIDAIRDYLKLPARLEPLRDDIAHCEWTQGENEDSVQPSWILRPLGTIKAVHDPAFVLGGGDYEDADDLAEYTPTELAQIAERLAENYASFHAYLEEVGRV